MRAYILVIFATLFGLMVPAPSAKSATTPPPPGKIFYFTSANELYGDCTTPGRITACLGYIEAVADIQQNQDDVLGAAMACIPTGVTGDRLRGIVLDVLDIWPPKVRRHAPAAQAVATALETKFPCPSKRR